MDMPAPLKILALIGSPRNEESYTYKVIRMIEQQMNRIQPTDVEYVFIEKVAVPFCDGCLHCVTEGEDSCPQYDKIGPIAAKMDAADGLILGSPVHTFAVTGLMKNFVEYFMYKRNRPSFFAKKTLVTATAAGGGHINVLDFLEGTATAWGCDVVAKLGISSGQMKKPAYRQLVEEDTADIAKTFVGEIKKDELGSPSFKQLMNFRAMQHMTRSQPGSVNYQYWQERNWLDKEYYTDVSINPVSRLMAGYIAGKMRKSSRKGSAKPVR
jgi:multimeric flavodoxin WrbA